MENVLRVAAELDDLFASLELLEADAAKCLLLLIHRLRELSRPLPIHLVHQLHSGGTLVSLDWIHRNLDRLYALNSWQFLRNLQVLNVRLLRLLLTPVSNWDFISNSGFVIVLNISGFAAEAEYPDEEVDRN